jgi:tetratricopeptide (TPR) repeat protein
MRKVFLCHSSQDKQYARIIAKRLGRARIVFDEKYFQPGHDFRQEILKGLEESALFVFMASKPALDSIWCKFEIDEAQLKKISGKMEASLTLIIDSGVTFSDLPRWMQMSKVVIQTRPSQATRDIQSALFSILSHQLVKPFVGRQDLQQEFIRRISDLGIEQPRILIAHGLDGNGRRSYFQRVCKDTIGLNLGPSFSIDQTIGLDDLYLWVLDETSDLGTRQNMADELRTFSALNVEERISEIVNRLSILCQDNIPCLVDAGGMLDDLGRYRPEYIMLINTFACKTEDCYIAIVHTRSPLVYDLTSKEKTLLQNVRPLNNGETKLLLNQLFRKMGLKVDTASMNEIVPFLDGYPPSVYFATSFAERYGLSTLVADKSLLNDFKARSFTRFINDLNLTDPEWLILQYLAAENTVPLSAVAIAADINDEQVAPLLRNLIDHSLVLSIDEKFSVSPPIKAAILRAKGFFGKDLYQRIGKKFTEVFWSDPEAGPTIEVVDATLNAVARSGSTDFQPYQDIVRVSVVHRLAQECYYQKEWGQALEYALRAEKMDPSRKAAKVLHFKSLVQLEKWKEAESKLAEIEKSGDRNTFYLKGFMLRKKHLFRQAIDAFESALLAGDHSYSVHRDYADCLYRCHRYEDALNKIEWVLERDSENIFVLDLKARICIDGKLLGPARDSVQKLERCDIDKKFIHHRKARLFSAQNIWDLALGEAEAACGTGHSPFEAFAQRIDILIELKNYPIASDYLNELEKRFRAHRKDIQTGLRCKLLTRQGRWREAKITWDRITDKTLPVHEGLLLRILEQKGKDNTVPLAERNAALDQANKLKLMLEREYSIVDIEAENFDIA